mgnify:CR=1 FL=1
MSGLDDNLLWRHLGAMPLLRDPRTYLLVLVWIAAVVAQIRTSVFDLLLLDWLYAGSTAWLVRAAGFVTALGGWKVLVPFTLLAAWILLRRGERRHALYLLAFAVWGRAVVDIVKLTVGRTRPDGVEHLSETFSASFPSGHAANSTIVYCTAAILLAPRRPGVLGAALALSFAIGVSRLFLGVHWPSDVVGGWTLGLLWTLALHRLVQNEGTTRRASSLMWREEPDMSDNERTEAARRNDDSDLIDQQEGAPSFSGAAGGNLQRDIASRAEQQHDDGGKPGVTRVQDKDKPEQANLPRYNESN